MPAREWAQGQMQVQESTLETVWVSFQAQVWEMAAVRVLELMLQVPPQRRATCLGARGYHLS